MTRVAEITGILIFIAILLPSCNKNSQNITITGEPIILSTSEEPVIPAAPIDLAKLYRDARPSIVSVKSDTLNGANIGTGFVLDKEGHIVTGYHVVKSESNLEVKFSTGEIAPASLVGKDEISDLAVLKLEAPVDELNPLKLGISDQVMIGQTVAVIGNPYGLEGTMTTGIISGAGQGLRYLQEMLGGGRDLLGEIIVTDTPINPGNSGGPLINTSGEVIGIIRNVITTRGKNQPSGIAFALPVDIAKPIIKSLVEQGDYVHPELGFSAVDQLTLEEIESLGLPVYNGIYVTGIESGGPAEDAGLIAGSDESNTADLPPGGDLILAVDNTILDNYNQLMAYVIKDKHPGDVIKFTVLRGKREIVIQLTIGIKKESTSDDW